MAAGTTDILVRFLADTSKLQSETAKVEGTGGKLKTWAKGVGAAIGTAFVVDKLRDFTTSAAELQDQVSASEQVFGSASESIVAFGEKAAAAFGMSKTEAISAANNVAAFGKGAGLAGDDLSTFATDLVGLAGDLASFRGTSPEQAIAAIGSALQGQAEPMRAYGVLLDEGSIKARALSMGLVAATGDADKIAAAQIQAASAQKTYNDAVAKHGEGSSEAAIAAQKLELAQSKLTTATEGTVPELTQQQRVMATQAEIFAQTGDAQGDFARTSDSAANSSKTLTAEMDNAGASIGEALLPVVETFLPYLTQMATYFKENSSWLVPLTGALVAAGAAIWVVTAATKAFQAAGLIAKAATIAWTAAQWLWNVAMMANPLVLIAIAVAALIAIIVLLVLKFDFLETAAASVWSFMQTAWDAILGIIKGVWEWISNNWPTLLAILTGPIGVAVLLISRNWSTIQDALAAVWNWIKSAWGTLADVLTAPFRIAGDLIRAAIDKVRGVISGAWDFISGIVTSITDAVTGIPDKVKDIGSRIAGLIKGPVNAIIRAWNGLSFKIPEVEIFGKKLGGGEIGTPHVSELARGGIVTAPTLALIGERGPEAVIPLDRGTVGGGGRTYVLNVNVAPGTDPAQTGRTIVDLIQSYERANGTDWRRAVV